jgi:drug/metabolite transporter (DMT)-like permease
VPWSGLVSLLVIYVVWGSTYLAIRIAVREGSGFPPFTLAAMRLLAAGGLLLLWCAARGMPIRLRKADLGVLLVVAALLWLGGNGLVTWAEQWADSGYAALLIASVPIWAAVIEAVLDRRPPTVLLVLALAVGLAGVALLVWPSLAGAALHPAAVAALLLAAITWAGGTVIQRRRPVPLTPLVSAAYQLVLGGVVVGGVALLIREPLPQPTPEAWLAWGYLVVLGSLVGFTSYVRALHLLPTEVALTYAYVNPVVAVILGAWLLHEPVTLTSLAGMVLILLGVAGVFREQYRVGRA